MYLLENNATITLDMYSRNREDKLGSNSVIPTEIFRGVPPPA
jgi:hypothetical protein